MREELAQVQEQPTPAQVAAWLGGDPAVVQVQTERRQAEQRLVTIPGMLARAEEMTLQGAYTIEEYRKTKRCLEDERVRLEGIFSHPMPMTADPQGGSALDGVGGRI